MWNLEYMRQDRQAFTEIYNLCTLKELIKVIEKSKNKYPQIKSRDLTRIQKKDLLNVFIKKGTKSVDNGFKQLLDMSIFKKTRAPIDNDFDENNVLKLSSAKSIYDKLKFKNVSFESFLKCIYEENIYATLNKSEIMILLEETDDSRRFKEMQNKYDDLFKKYDSLVEENKLLKNTLSDTEEKMKKSREQIALLRTKNKQMNKAEIIKKLLSREKFNIVKMERYFGETMQSTLEIITKHEQELDVALLKANRNSEKRITVNTYMQLVILKYILLKSSVESEGISYE